MRITAIETILLDIPRIRPHHLSFGSYSEASYCLVRMQTDEGIEGLGEMAKSGGPGWNEESTETAKVVIDRYLAPLLIGLDPFGLETIHAQLGRYRGNLFAKSAVEMACWDIVGKALGRPLYDLIGGLYRDRIPLSWSLASGDADQEIEEAERLIERGHFIFKIKVGEHEPVVDAQRVRRIAEALGDRARVRVDANQGWDELSSLAALPVFEACGVELFEQPVPRWNLEAMARIAARASVPIMADESVCTPHDALDLVRHAAADVFALKLAKAGGILPSKAVAGIAVAAGIPCYVGCMTETGIGSAAYAHFSASTPAVTLGCELFGPPMIVEDIVKEPIPYEQGHILVPTGPGLGVELDEAQVRKFRRE